MDLSTQQLKPPKIWEFEKKKRKQKGIGTMGWAWGACLKCTHDHNILLINVYLV